MTTLKTETSLRTLDKKRQPENLTNGSEPPIKKQKIDSSVSSKSKKLKKTKITKTPKKESKEELAKWSNLDVGPLTSRAIDQLGFESMMEIQYKAIHHVLDGKDVAAAAKTGSGKTLAFVIPCIELLARDNWNKSKGTGAIMIAPTRELAIQIKGVAQTMAAFHRTIRVGLVIGGNPRYAEVQMLKMGCAIIAATPGRLMDHLENTSFRFDLLKILVIDEADHILDIGFEHQMHAILSVIPTERQTLLFSATLTEKTKDLVTMAFRKKPMFVRAKGEEAGPTADKLTQHYCVIEQKNKLVSILTWLRQNKDLKILVFFSTKKATMFYEKLFRAIGIRVLALYGAMKQHRRTQTFFKFVEATSGILLATNVASRGLDFPSVHWIIQYDPPQNPKEYIHRVGRTARAGLKGQAMAFIQPSEMEYIELLEECGLDLKEIKINDIDFEGLSTKLEEVVSSNYELKQYAVDACRAFTRSYDQRAYTIFNNNGVDKQQAAQSFALLEFPKRGGGGGYGGFQRNSYQGQRGRGRGGGRGRRNRY